jgi:hypothetical protein
VYCWKSDLLFVYTLQGKMARLDQRMARLEEKLDALQAGQQASNPPSPQMDEDFVVPAAASTFEELLCLEKKFKNKVFRGQMVKK